MRKFFTILVFLVILFSSSASDAMSAFERFVLWKTHLFRLVVLVPCIVGFLIIIAYRCLLGRKERMLLGSHVRGRLLRKKNEEKAVIERIRAYRKIPKGAIGDVSSSPGKLIHIKSKEEYVISALRELTIGRSLENLVVVERTSVSRNHAKIRPQEEGYVLYDLLSEAGTYVNDKKIMKHVLRDGDVVKIGKETFTFKL